MNNKNLFLRLINLSREEWPILLKGMIFLIISSAALMVYPQYIKVIIDDAMKSKDMAGLNKAALIAMIVFIIQAVSSSLRFYYFTLAGEKTVKRLRSKLFSQIISQEMPFFDFSKTGELLGRLSADTAVLQNALSVNISMLFRTFFQAVGGLVLLFVTSTKLTIFILIIIPPIALLVAIFGKKVKSISKATQDALAMSSSVAEESISGVRTVKAFAQENWEIGRYDEQLQKSFDLSKSRISVVANFTGLVSTLGFLAIVFIVWFGGKLVIQGEMSIGTLTSYILYVMTVAFSAGLLGSLYTDFMSAFGAGHRLFELMEKSTVGVENSNKPLKVISEGLIEIKDADFSYPARADVLILNQLSLQIAAKETVAIVGSSGGGKSTIAQLLMRFYDLNTGEIFIDHKSIKEYDLYALRNQIGIVSQEPILISESIEDNIRYGKPDASFEEVMAAAKLAYAHDFVSQFPEGYKTLVGEKGVQLSGGQKQRVAIARAILKNPKILILDEATSALDSESESLVQRALENLRKSRTTLIIAHRLSTVKNADKIFVLDQGKIVQVGSHEELILSRDGFYNKLIEKQFNH
ncbi:MAG: ATP-binding cassette domain-containing protein [Bdellovibrionales bacterium]|nr:ATP-binding cassette domain-containing protein [Bdellovibrionales bacterium]